MKNDLASAIVACIVGLIVAFFVTGFFKGEIEPFTIKTIEETVDIDLAEPNPEVFNYRALNPTVEVFVGLCIEYNENGECVEAIDEAEQQAQESSEVVEEQEN